MSSHYIVAYDIRANKRRRRVAGHLEALGERVQASVFVLHCQPAAADRLRKDLLQMVDTQTDRILVHALRNAPGRPARPVVV